MKVNPIDYDGIYSQSDNPRSRLFVTVQKRYRFMFVIKSNGKEKASEIEYLVRNECCGKEEWINHVRFFRRLAVNCVCRDCSRPWAHRKMESELEDRYDAPYAGIKGWGLFLKRPFGRLHMRGSYHNENRRNKTETEEPEDEYETTSNISDLVYEFEDI